MELHLHYRSDREVVAEAGPLLVRVVNGVETDQSSVDRLVTTLDSMLARRTLIGMVVIVEHDSPRPSPEIRERVDKELRRYGEQIVLGYALLGLGFWAFDAGGFAAERVASLGTVVLVERELGPLAERMALELVGVDAERLVRRCEALRAMVGA